MATKEAINKAKNFIKVNLDPPVPQNWLFDSKLLYFGGTNHYIRNQNVITDYFLSSNTSLCCNSQSVAMIEARMYDRGEKQKLKSLILFSISNLFGRR